MHLSHTRFDSSMRPYRMRPYHGGRGSREKFGSILPYFWLILRNFHVFLLNETNVNSEKKL